MRQDTDADIAEFIRKKGVTRCPTACVLATQATLSLEDRTRLERHADEREAARQTRSIGRGRAIRSEAQA
jgi:hypothetical protein